MPAAGEAFVARLMGLEAFFDVRSQSTLKRPGKPAYSVNFTTIKHKAGSTHVSRHAGAVRTEPFKKSLRQGFEP
jgi:hypothetical protein